MDDIVGAVTPPGFIVHTLGGDDEHLYIASVEEPASVVHAA
jgi:hypothetical protein